MKKIFIISISAILGMFTQIDSSYAVESCGIPSLDTSIGGGEYGFTCLNGNAGGNESNYGLTTGSGQWATEFSYGTVWGMAKCSETSGNHGYGIWSESSKSDWLKTPSDTTGGNCWCQATGFTASGNSYTSGPQCTTAASSLWVFCSNTGSSDGCASDCASYCATRVRSYAAFRAGVFGAVPGDPVGLAWYDNGTAMSGGPSYCAVGGTFVPPTPPARPGYVFAGWKIKHKTHPTCGIPDLSISTTGKAYGYYVFATDRSSSNVERYGLNVRGQWATEFSFGTVYGMANCNTTAGSYLSVATITPESSGRYCWCQFTGFTPTNDSYTSGPQCTITPAASSWVYNAELGTAYECSYKCPQYCGDGVRAAMGFCNKMFTVAGN